jgi:enoyl-CoA hydratase/carnithine racemase
MPTDLRVETHEGVLHLTIDRQERRNALSAAVIDGMIAALAATAGDRSIRAVVITGAGEKAFCAGADLQSGGAFAFDYSEPYANYAQLLRAAKGCNVPLIARVNGACMAGGMGLLAMCDLAIAAPHAVFGLPEVKVGVFPMQVLSVIQHLVPRRELARLCITGESIDAKGARAIGLLNEVADDLDAAIGALLDTIARNAPSAIRRGLYALKRVEAMAFEEAIAFTEGQIGLLAMTEDAREGTRAFAEKRAPVWTGR